MARSMRIDSGTAAALTQAGPKAYVVGLFSIQGGVGKSLLAANLAAGLGARHPDEVALIDCDLRGGAGLADELGTDPAVTLLDWLVHPPGANARTSEYFVRHRCGFRLLAGTHEPYRLASFTPAEMVQRIAELTPYFRYVILDLPTGFDPLTLALLHVCQRVYVPVRGESAHQTAVRYLRRHLDWAGLSPICRWVFWTGPATPAGEDGEGSRSATHCFPWSPLVVARATAMGCLPIEWSFTTLGQALQEWTEQFWLETSTFRPSSRAAVWPGASKCLRCR